MNFSKDGIPQFKKTSGLNKKDKYIDIFIDLFNAELIRFYKEADENLKFVPVSKFRKLEKENQKIGETLLKCEIKWIGRIESIEQDLKKFKNQLKLADKSAIDNLLLSLKKYEDLLKQGS